MILREELSKLRVEVMDIAYETCWSACSETVEKLMRSPTIIAIVMGVATETVDRCTVLSGLVHGYAPPRNSRTWLPTWIWSPAVERDAHGALDAYAVDPDAVARRVDDDGPRLLGVHPDLEMVAGHGQIVAEQDPMRIVHARALASDEEPVEEGAGSLARTPGSTTISANGSPSPIAAPASSSRGGSAPRSSPGASGIDDDRLPGLCTSAWALSGRSEERGCGRNDRELSFFAGSRHGRGLARR